MAAKPKFKGVKLSLRKVRLSYPELWVPKAFLKADGTADGEPAYGASFLLDPNNPENKEDAQKVSAELKRAIQETWGQKPAKLKQDCFGRGDDCIHQETGLVYDGYAGMIFVRGKSKKQPLIIDKSKNELKNGDARVYAGVYCNATVNLFIGDPKFGPRVCCALRAIMPLGYGEPFGNVVTDADFDDFDIDDDDGLGLGNDEDDIGF